MGDRAMARIKVKDGELFFYTHWSGSKLPAHAREALRTAQPRIGDDPYALRIVVDQLINLSHSRDRESGSGLLLKPDAEDEYNSNKPSVTIDLIANSLEIHGRHTK